MSDEFMNSTFIFRFPNCFPGEVEEIKSPLHFLHHSVRRLSTFMILRLALKGWKFHHQLFHGSFHQWQSYIPYSRLPPHKKQNLTWQNGKSTIWRCISWGFSHVLWVLMRDMCEMYGMNLDMSSLPKTTAHDTRNVQHIERSNPWDAKRNGTSTTLIYSTLLCPILL